MKRLLLILTLSLLAFPCFGQGILFESAWTTSAGTVATPTFSSGSSSPITISDSNSGLTGFAMTYCTDGTNTCTPSTSYSGAVTVTGTGYIRAQATATGYMASAVGSAAYTISAGIAAIGGACIGSSSSVSALTVSYSPTAGNTVLVFPTMVNTSYTVTSVTASNSTSLTKDLSVTNWGNDNINNYVERYTNVPAGITGFTANYSSSVPDTGICVLEVSNLNTSPYDAGTGTGTDVYINGSWTGAPLTPTSGKNEIIVEPVFAEGAVTITATSPWVTLPSQDSTTGNTFGLVYQIIPSTSGSYTPAGSVTGSWTHIQTITAGYAH